MPTIVCVICHSRYYKVIKWYTREIRKKFHLRFVKIRVTRGVLTKRAKSYYVNFTRHNLITHTYQSANETSDTF